MNKPPHNKIHAFCTVDPSFLEKVGDQIFCRKCSREMANLDLEISDNKQPSSKLGTRSRQLLCGVISVAALSACSPTSRHDRDEGTYYGKIAPDEQFPLPGTTAMQPSADNSARQEAYPLATHVPGRPGTVESPYGGHLVDVSRIPPGSLVIDPKFGAESDQFFRI